ncbi:large ribosomal subunit protein mL62-like [Sycon ciliatum]|uniref:large ribosomal subunit protein mL62-like n=1 Tax=Sycon ciliatum TaxID=27933 RepID=UPI0031F6BFDE
MPEYYDGTTFSGPIPLEKVKVEYVCSSGAGGQHVNKTASKACLSFNVLEATWLPKWIRHRLLVKAKTHVNKQGILLVTCDSERTQSFNLREARSKIESLIKEASRLPNERTVEDEKAIVRSMHRQNMNRLRNKKHASALKRSRTDFD